MREHLDVVFAIGLGLTLAMALAPAAAAEPNPVTAIDIALEPDATMIQHAMAANARLLKAFPKGFALDATHHPHISMLQQFVRTDDLDVWTESRRTGSMRQPCIGRDWIVINRDGHNLAFTFRVTSSVSSQFAKASAHTAPNN